MEVHLPQPTEWWQTAVFYQIYPRSFADGNGDGIGDLWGAHDRLDYLAWLGVDAVWLSPHFPSPQADFGYDVSDYTGVNPEYGDLAVFDRFLMGAHDRGIKVILDLVVNHSSHQHPWFVASRNLESPFRDWYVWRTGSVDSDGTPQPPNNWQSVFGGPAWTYDESSRQWYYHFFLKEQPDLNWDNPEVRQAMWTAVRFWLDRGVNGFRLDAIGTLFEDPSLEDHDPAGTLISLLDTRFTGALDAQTRGEQWRAMFRRQHDLPGVHEVMRELRTVIEEYEGRVLVGETDDLRYHGDGSDELHLVFNFPLMNLPELSPDMVRRNQRLRLRALPEGAWPCNTFGNHDADRTASRWNHDGHGQARARLAAALALTLPGTPSLYMGEEIGMEDYLAADPADLLDPIGPWYYEEARAELELSHEVAKERAARFSRDRCRTPMQWDASANAGFSPAGITPWLPVHGNHQRGVNVADQRNVEGSMLTLYRELVALHATHEALRSGGYEEIDPANTSVFAFRRPHGDGTIIVALNMDLEPARCELPPFAPLYRSGDGIGTDLAPFEIVIGVEGHDVAQSQDNAFTT